MPDTVNQQTHNINREGKKGEERGDGEGGMGRGSESKIKAQSTRKANKKIKATGKHVSTMTLSVNGSTCQEMPMPTRLKGKIHLLAVSKTKTFTSKDTD